MFIVVLVMFWLVVTHLLLHSVHKPFTTLKRGNLFLPLLLFLFIFIANHFTTHTPREIRMHGCGSAWMLYTAKISVWWRRCRYYNTIPLYYDTRVKYGFTGIIMHLQLSYRTLRHAFLRNRTAGTMAARKEERRKSRCERNDHLNSALWIFNTIINRAINAK